MKTLKTLLMLSISTMIISLGLVGCTSKETRETIHNTEQNAQKQSKKYAMIYKNTDNVYGEKAMEGFKNAIEEMQAGEVILKVPKKPTAAAQIEMIEECIAEEVDCIVIVANDADALELTLKKAMKSGIKVLSSDSAVNPASRMVHINQADAESIGRVQIKAISQMIGEEGEIAILSSTPQATNQNEWIEWMKKELEDPKYSKIKLVKIAYGEDMLDKSKMEIEALLKDYPKLKGIIAPTTVGIAAAGSVLSDSGLPAGKVVLMGLGLPSEMERYITSGISPWIYLWNPVDMGYLTGQTAVALVEGRITGAKGETFEVGRLGTREITQHGEGTEILLGEPFKIDQSNIQAWKDVY